MHIRIVTAYNYPTSSEYSLVYLLLCRQVTFTADMTVHLPDTYDAMDIAEKEL